MREKSPHGIKWKRILRWTGIILAVIFLLLSIIPYLIPVKPLGGDRHELVYANSEFLDLDGVEIHYRIFNNKADKAGNVLLVHGFGASTFTWRHTAPYLQDENFLVVAVDLPGFGLSERRKGLNHSPDARAECLWALLLF